jgi:hypothetical protein
MNFFMVAVVNNKLCLTVFKRHAIIIAHKFIPVLLAEGRSPPGLSIRPYFADRREAPNLIGIRPVSLSTLCTIIVNFNELA